MDFGSVCSGIEAASVAFGPLGWKAAWFSEIEPFPSAVLAHHYPGVPNHGDMTTLPRRILTGEVNAPAMLCGGTPCQAFSVAGLRQSLDDDRGNLTMTFCEIANAIDHVRAARGDDPGIIFWENVPGVLSTKDNAFGCFLAALVGESEPLVPTGGRWTDAGVVYGPTRSAAWRVLDAQYFGLAQRRRRVFVIASSRNGFDPAAILFESEGVRRDSAPRREAWKGIAGGTTRRPAGGHVVNALTANNGQRNEVSDAVNGSVIPWPADIACTLNAAFGDKQGLEDQHALSGASLFVPALAHILKGEGFDASEDGTGRGTPLVPVAVPLQEVGKRTGASTDDPRAGIGIGQDGDPMFTLQAGAQHGVAVAVALRGREGGGTAELGDEVQNCLRASSGGGDKPHVLAPVVGAIAAHSFFGGAGGRPEGAAAGHFVPVASMAVRRLTPRECERLQGFPDDYTAIPWKRKPADECPDGPRYKALGNSWAVPCVRWIGWRIQQHMAWESAA